MALAPDGSSTSTLTLTPVDNFLPESVTFTCSVPVALAGVTCTVGDLGGNDIATVTLTAASTATSYPALPRNPRFGAWWVAGVAMLALLLIALWGWRPRAVQVSKWNLRQVALIVVVTTLLAASLSCGGGGGGGGGETPPPPPESGTVTVTGTSGSATHSAQISVTVS